MPLNRFYVLQHFDLSVASNLAWVFLSIHGSLLTLSPFYRFVPVKRYLPVNLPVNRWSGKFQKLAALILSVGDWWAGGNLLNTTNQSSVNWTPFQTVQWPHETIPLTREKPSGAWRPFHRPTRRTTSPNIMRLLSESPPNSVFAISSLPSADLHETPRRFLWPIRAPSPDPWAPCCQGSRHPRSTSSPRRRVYYNVCCQN